MAHPYATVGDMVLRYGLAELNKFPLIQNAGLITQSGGAYESVVLSNILEEASSDIDVFAQLSGYSVPFDIVLTEIKTRCQIIALKKLYDSTHTHTPIENFKQDFKDAYEWLDKLAKKEISLVGVGRSSSVIKVTTLDSNYKNELTIFAIRDYDPDSPEPGRRKGPI